MMYEVEYEVLEELKPKVKSDFLLMHEIVNEIKKENLHEILKSLNIEVNLEQLDSARKKYKNYLIERIQNKGVMLKKHKSCIEEEYIKKLDDAMKNNVKKHSLEDLLGDN